MGNFYYDFFSVSAFRNIGVFFLLFRDTFARKDLELCPFRGGALLICICFILFLFFKILICFAGVGWRLCILLRLRSNVYMVRELRGGDSSSVVHYKQFMTT